MKTDEKPAEPATCPAWGLWSLCVIVGSGLLLMWASGRVKPLILYPLAIGVIVGVWTRMVSVVCHIERLRWGMLLPPVCAVAVTFGGLVISSQRQPPDIPIANPLAERLLRQFDEQTPPTASETVTSSRFSEFLRQRYQRGTITVVTIWLIGELALAATVCAGVLLLFRHDRRAVHAPRPPTEFPVRDEH